MAAGFAIPAQAQVFWPSESSRYHRYYDAYEAPPPVARPRTVRRQKLPDAPKDTAKPSGPVIIAVSIEQQNLKIYDQNGLFAETPVSTGMAGHSTPTGVFSIIQKNKYHRSNLYSNAPMPYMQRITWSGVAMHAGALPGYPASHGCVRLPMNFAMRLWGWTRMGARVIITPGEVSPADVSHPLLIARKPEPQPVAATPAPRDDSAAAKSGSSSVADASVLDRAELRLTPIHDRSEPIRTADASGALPQRDDMGSVAAAPNSAAAATDTSAKDDANKNDMTASSGVATTREKPLETKADAEVPATNEDQPRAADPAPSAASAELPLEGSSEFVGPVKPRSGHVAAFVSRKEGKIYVRQGFEPWFEMPVTIAGSEPLGTHVFTARADKDDAGAFRWSVVSLPVPMRNARADDTRPRKKRAVISETAPRPAPSTPGEALDRLTIPDGAMQRIASAIAPGGSLVVSDQGLGDETGRGTDFIVPLR